ncbi:MAG: hypothetical protein CFE34_04440 [Rhodobacteraceae bacterium PARR1]|nr:MAG: hypothetical protein CFE34_04440 [Rhodobacteraceae bacterium PARR1]
MPDSTPVPQQMAELTQAIYTLLPAVKRLEDCLTSMDQEAILRQQQMAEALSRIAAALGMLLDKENQSLAAMGEQKKAHQALTDDLQTMSRSLLTSAASIEKLEGQISSLLMVLQSPA